MKKFTLVELIIVMAIIAVLVSILVPSLSRARDTTKQVVCLSNTKQLGVASQVYLFANNNCLARGAQGWDFATTLGGPSRGVTFLALSTYLGLKEFYDGSVSPGVTQATPPAAFRTKRDILLKSSNVFRCPSKSYDPWRLVDYSVNSLHFTKYYSAGSYAEAGYIPGEKEEFVWPTRVINKLSETILFGENIRNAADFYNTNIQFYAPDHLPWKNSVANLDTTMNRMIPFADQTHNGKTSMTAFDGSGKIVYIRNGKEWINNSRLTGK